MIRSQTATPHTEEFVLFNPIAVDGDTVDAWVDLGFNTCTKQRFRLKGFYAPELDGDRPEEGRKAQELLQRFLTSGNLTVPRRGMKKDRYGRWLATVRVDGIAADPFIAIFPYQLTEEAHRQDLEAQKRRKRGSGVGL